MLNIIIALFGLTRDAMLPLRRIYFRIIVRTFIAIIILTIIGWLINIAGLPGLNILFFLILLTTAVIVAFMPDSLAVTLAAGIVSGIAEEPETIEDEVKSFSKAYMKAACEITFWISIAFFFLGTMSFQERPSAFFLIVSALAVIGLVSYKLDIVGRLGWKVVLYYAVIVLMVNILGLIPGYIWVKVTGHNPVSTFSISNTEKNISTIGDLSSKIEDERNSARLNEIIDKMKNSKITEAELSDEDKEFLKKMRENKAQENLPCRISGIVERISIPVPEPAKLTSEPTKICYVPVPEQTIAPEPVIPRVNLYGRWSIRWGNNLPIIQTLSNNRPLYISCNYRDENGIDCWITLEGVEISPNEFSGTWNYHNTNRENKSGTFTEKFSPNIGKGIMADVNGDTIPLYFERV